MLSHMKSVSQLCGLHIALLLANDLIQGAQIFGLQNTCNTSKFGSTKHASHRAMAISVNSTFPRDNKIVFCLQLGIRNITES